MSRTRSLAHCIALNDGLGARGKEAALSEGACQSHVALVPRDGPLLGRIKWGCFVRGTYPPKSAQQKHSEESLPEGADSRYPPTATPKMALPEGAASPPNPFCHVNLRWTQPFWLINADEYLSSG
jgi:hypothetical protein